jgi:hypothetical protein
MGLDFCIVLKWSGDRNAKQIEALFSTPEWSQPQHGGHSDRSRAWTDGDSIGARSAEFAAGATEHAAGAAGCSSGRAVHAASYAVRAASDTACPTGHTIRRAGAIDPCTERWNANARDCRLSA